MYSEIKEYIEPVLSGLKEVDSGFDVDMLPVNQMNDYYFIKFESIEDEEAESYSIDTIAVSIELWFLLANKKDIYADVVDKVNVIKKSLKELTFDNTNEATLQIINIQNLKVQGLNNIIKNNWLKCSIDFGLRIFDGQ